MSTPRQSLAARLGSPATPHPQAGTHRVGLGSSKGCSTLEAAVPAEGVQHRPTQPSRVKGLWARCGGSRAVPVGAGRGANEAPLTSWRCAQAWGRLQ